MTHWANDIRLEPENFAVFQNKPTTTPSFKQLACKITKNNVSSSAH